MIHRNVKDLPAKGSQIQYIDALTGETITAVVGEIEKITENGYFVYTVSPYKDENQKSLNGFRFRDVIVFDDQPEEVNGIRKDYIRAQYEKGENPE